jgi:hypothetical protein
MEEKIAESVAEIVTALIVTALPEVLVTVKVPASEMVEPGLTLMLTVEVTATVSWA